MGGDRKRSSSCPNALNSQGWVRPKPKSPEFKPISHMDSRDSNIWAVIYCLKDTLTGSQIRGGGTGTRTSNLTWDGCRAAKWQLDPLYYNAWP